MPDVQRRQLVPVGPAVAHEAVELGREDGLVAALAALREPRAEDLLGPAAVLAPAVHVGGVEEVDAVLVGLVHDRVRGGLVGLRTEVHRPEDEPGHAQAGPAEVGVLHTDSLPTVSRAKDCSVDRAMRWLAPGARQLSG